MSRRRVWLGAAELEGSEAWVKTLASLAIAAAAAWPAGPALARARR